MAGEVFRFLYQYVIAGKFLYKGDEFQNLLPVEYAEGRKKRLFFFWCGCFVFPGGGCRQEEGYIYSRCEREYVLKIIRSEPPVVTIVVRTRPCERQQTLFCPGSTATVITR